MLARPIPLITHVIICVNLFNVLHVWHIANGLSTTTVTSVGDSSVSSPNVTGKNCTEKETKKIVTTEYFSSVCYSEHRTCDPEAPFMCSTKKISSFCSQLRYKEVYKTSSTAVCCHGYILDTIQDVCIRVCPSDKFGDNCSEACTCLPTQVCDPYTGTCACKPGYTGPGCVNVCQQRTSGVNCKELCICHWNNTISCDGVSGACWCKRGWIGVACQTECPPGFFGFDCGNECNCSTNQTCDSETGDCACATGYTGVYCTERIVPLAKTQDDLPDYLLIVIQVILAVIVLVVILAFIIHCVRKKNLRKSHNCTEGSVTGNTNTILADYYSNLSVKELQKKRKQPGHHSPRRSKAPNGSLYTEVDRPNEPKQRLAPYQDSSVIFIKRTSIKDNGTGSIIENADKDHCLGSDDSSQVTAYVNEALNKEDAYDELGKDRHVTDAIPGKDQYDHMKLNQNKAGNGDDVYDKLEQRSRDKNVNDIDDTYDHTQHVSDK